MTFALMNTNQKIKRGRDGVGELVSGWLDCNYHLQAVPRFK